MPDLVAAPVPAREEDELQLGSMGLLQHLEELRRRIFYSIISVGVCFGFAWYKWETIYALMKDPVEQALRNHKLPTELGYLNPTDPFNLSLKIGLLAGIFIACPLLLYQVWMFISPGLYRKEKRFVLPFLFLSIGLFISGGLFGYKIVFPVALDFLIGTGANAGMKPMITITEYTDLFLTILLGLALIFDVIAAILTPTTDIMNMTIYAAPMIMLYIMSIGIVWLVHPKQRRKRREKREQDGQ
jgi:sec-independent protein translocase protein TatC